MRSRGFLVGAIIMVGCLVVGVAVLLTRSGEEQQAHDGPAPSPSTTLSSEPGQAQQVAGALAKLATDPAALVPAGAPPGVKAQAAQAVPKGSSVAASPESWQPDGIGGGVMTVTISAPGQPAVSYAAVVAQENGSWKVLATMKLPTRAASPTATAS